jgi:hypothetical protein
MPLIARTTTNDSAENEEVTLSIRTGSVLTILLFLSGMACSAEKVGGSTGSGALGSTWADASKMPDLFTGMWMTLSGAVEADERLDVPYTAKAQKLVDAYEFKRDLIPYADEGCQTPGLPIAMRSGPIKFTYSPGLLSIYIEGFGHTRFIRMNQPMGKTSPKYYGNSVGHWEGDTLVVETADFLPEISFQYGIGKGLPQGETFAPPGAPDPRIVAAIPKAIWGPHGEGMHMVERMRLVDPNAMELKLTVYDDTVWTKPYVAATRNYRRIVKGHSEFGPFNGEPEEWVCTVSITSFDPETNTYQDKDPEEVVKYLDKLDR